MSVVLDNGFWSREERQAYRGGAAAAGAQTRLHYLDVPLDELKRRIMRRNAALADRAFFVHPNDVDGWFASFEAPTRDELDHTS